MIPSKCPICNQLYEHAKTCKITLLKDRKTIYQRQPVEKTRKGKRCLGCNIFLTKGNYHHYPCVYEECSICANPLQMCVHHKSSGEHSDICIDCVEKAWPTHHEIVCDSCGALLIYESSAKCIEDGCEADIETVVCHCGYSIDIPKE